MTPTQVLKQRALALGFDAVGVAAITPLDAARRFEAWLAAGFHGGMEWLASGNHRARRADPERICPGLEAVLCVALHYPAAADPARDRRLGRIARYAGGEDYHRLMKEKLLQLERFIRGELFPGSRALWYSDTGAILERGWAERAGLGWIGKHSGLLARERGSYFLLGEVLVDRPLDPDPPQASDHCGSCVRCLEVCPTRAIVAPYRVDARRCISYLTIEHRGAIPSDLREAIGDWIFGCDLCQEACPWNRFAAPARESRLHARAYEGWSLERFLALGEAEFAALFATSPIRRAGRDGFLRNVCVALGNRGEPGAIPPLAAALAADPAPLVRAHAAWALGAIGRRSGDPAARMALARVASADPDPAVREEAAAALAALGA